MFAAPQRWASSCWRLSFMPVLDQLGVGASNGSVLTCAAQRAPSITRGKPYAPPDGKGATPRCAAAGPGQGQQLVGRQS